MYSSMWNTPFNKAVFQTTHNSYRSSPGPVKKQLDAGVRGLEFDIWWSNNKFRLGHDDPGENISHTGNPSSEYLDAWLSVLTDWSNANHDHDPIMLYLDMKEPMTTQLDKLNDTISSAFGSKLFTAAKYKQSGWPAVGDLKGRILVILSGDNGTRANYANPAKGYSQVMFSESQGDDSTDVEGAPFYAVKAEPFSQSGDPGWVSKQKSGKIVRLWDFKSEDIGDAIPNLAATDTPYDDWYTCYCFRNNAFGDTPGLIFNSFDNTTMTIPVQGPNGANTLCVINGVASFTLRGRCPEFNMWARTTISFPAYSAPSGEEVVQAMVIGGPASYKSTSGTKLGWSVDNTRASWASLAPPVVVEDSTQPAATASPEPISVTPPPPPQQTDDVTLVKVNADIAVYCTGNQALLRMACQLLVFAKSAS